MGIKFSRHKLNVPWPIAIHILTLWLFLLSLIFIRKVNPHPPGLIYLNFQLLEVVSRYREPQPQVVEYYSYLVIWDPNIYKSWCLSTHFIPNNSDIYSANKTTIVVISMQRVNYLTAKLFNLYFHSLEVMSRWRDPQLQVSENYSDLIKRRSIVFKYWWLMSHFILNMFKRWYIMCW